jgi:hypothetical protein
MSDVSSVENNLFYWLPIMTWEIEGEIEGNRGARNKQVQTTDHARLLPIDIGTGFPSTFPFSGIKTRTSQVTIHLTFKAMINFSFKVR